MMRRLLVALAALAAVALVVRSEADRNLRRAHADALRARLRALSHRLASGEDVEDEIAAVSSCLAAVRNG